MASTADFYMYIFFGRACFELIAAVASYFGTEIFRMDSRFHHSPSFLIVFFRAAHYSMAIRYVQIHRIKVEHGESKAENGGFNPFSDEA